MMTLATKVGQEAEDENTVGTLSMEEATEAVRRNKGDLWASVTDCVEGRRTKVMPLYRAPTGFWPESQNQPFSLSGQIP